MESESGSGGNEHVRAREVPIAEEQMTLALAQAAQMVQGRTGAEQRILSWAWVEEELARAKEELVLAKEELARAKEEGARAREEERRLAWAESEAEEQVLARAEEQSTRAREEEELAWEKEQLARWQEKGARAWEEEARTQALVQSREWARPEVEAQAVVRARAPAKARAEEWAQTLAEALPRALTKKVQAAERAEALARALAQARPAMLDAIPLLAEALNEQGVTPLFPQAVQSHPPTYAEVVPDLEIKRIIDSTLAIKPDYRLQLTRHLWGHSEHTWLIQILTPFTRLPLELLQSILSTVIDDASNSPLGLMLVCKHWYTTVTGIWAPLKLGTRTPRDAVTSKLERNPSLLDIVVDTEIDRGDFTPSETAYEAIFAAIEASSRWRSLVVETFPGLTDLPEHLVNRGLQRCSHSTMSRLNTFKVKSACEMSLFFDHLLRILGTTAGPRLTTVEINSANIISFLAPAYPSIFRSVKVLILGISATHDPVDLFPHLHQLEELTASHLSLPIYPDHIHLPFVSTLRQLTLRAVSIQWMSGRTFDVLESCTIRFPLRRHIPPIFRTALPNCKQLTFEGYPLDVLDGFSAHKLDHLSVTSSGSFKTRGARELVWFSSQVLGDRRLAPRILHISVEATSQAWINALASMTHLEELVIGNARPSLQAKVLQSLIARPFHVPNTGTTSTSTKWHAPLCPSLRRFGLKYHRWLRPSEHFDLIPDFFSIIFSREHSNYHLQRFSVWIRSDQEDPFEMINEWGWFNQSGVELLADESRIERQDLRRMRHRALTAIPVSSVVA